ncbi:MAG: hotdog fold thioesterase [Candidatus Latescibacteria bacterium]|nr:hotdog fold thioesterase [Candidatus Latescibacterota bacterium]
MREKIIIHNYSSTRMAIDFLPDHHDTLNIRKGVWVIMEIPTDVIQFIREKDTFAHKLGIKIIEAKDGCSHVSMELDETHANALGNVHGGVFFSLADLAFATACNSEGVLSVAIEASIQYMAPCRSEGVLEARGKKINETRRLGFYRIEVTRPEGDLVAVMQAVAYKKGNK